MQSVGEFVALGAQHRAHQLHGIELAGERLDVGSVLHHQNGSQCAPFAPHLSTGLGLRYLTPVGPFRADFGLRIPGAQVLNTKAIGIRFAEMCVACGMTQSALTYPRAKLSYEDFLK